MAAILEDSVSRYRRGPGNSRAERQAWEYERDWLFSDREGWLFDFASICRVLRIAPDYARRHLGFEPSSRVVRAIATVGHLPRLVAKRRRVRRRAGRGPQETKLSGFVRGLRRGGGEGTDRRPT